MEEPMRRFTIALMSTICIGALVGCNSSQPAAPQTAAANPGANEGTVTFSGGAVALGIGYQWGNGTLTFQGRQYPFRMSGLSVVDVGASTVTGSGTVRNLRRVADFSGNYVAGTAGATIAGGGSVTALQNQNGVVIDSIATSQGARLTLAPQGVSITLTGQ
jgi:hypothetical protein